MSPKTILVKKEHNTSINKTNSSAKYNDPTSLVKAKQTRYEVHTYRDLDEEWKWKREGNWLFSKKNQGKWFELGGKEVKKEGKCKNWNVYYSIFYYISKIYIYIYLLKI